jgi:hypothetical protein
MNTVNGREITEAEDVRAQYRMAMQTQVAMQDAVVALFRGAMKWAEEQNRLREERLLAVLRGDKEGT